MGGTTRWYNNILKLFFFYNMRKSFKKSTIHFKFVIKYIKNSWKYHQKLLIKIIKNSWKNSSKNSWKNHQKVLKIFIKNSWKNHQKFLKNSWKIIEKCIKIYWKKWSKIYQKNYQNLLIKIIKTFEKLPKYL